MENIIEDLIEETAFGSGGQREFPLWWKKSVERAVNGKIAE